MKLPKTLSELKRQNEESEKSDELETENTDELNTQSEQPADLEGDDLVDANEEEGVPAWLQTGENENDSEDDVQVPLKAHIAQRKKFQGNISTLRTDIEARDTQIEALTQTVQELRDAIRPENKTASTVPNVELPPVLADFEQEDNPDTAYQKAMLDWSMKTFENRQKQADLKQRQEQAALQREQELTRHYERAASLVEAGQLTPEEYRNADAFVRQAIEMTRPGEGKTIFNTLFADLGKGSEKVLISLYRNNANLSQLQQELTIDQTGIRASMFLGRLAADFERGDSRNKISSAPKPGSKVSGDSKRTVSTSEKKLRKEYDDAHKKQDVKAAFAAKKRAKAAGVDVSRWAYD